MMLHWSALLGKECAAWQPCRSLQLPLRCRLRTRPYRSAARLKVAPGRRSVRDLESTQCKNCCPAATSAAVTPYHDKSKDERSDEGPAAATLNIILKLMGIACFSLACLNCFHSCPSVGRFASLAAQSAENSGAMAMPAWTGLSAGFLHTLAGPDHLAGLTPLTLGQKQVAAVSMGALWGFGHSSGQLILGIAFLILKERFQGIVPFLSQWSGTLVGATLVAIGVVGIYESKFAQHHEATHETATSSDAKGGIAKRGLGTYAMGFVYGLQPDSLFVVLPALALPTALATLSYVITFVIGTVCAMAGYTFAIGTASGAATAHQPWLMQHLSTLAASVALGVGLLILLPNLGCPLPFAL